MPAWKSTQAKSSGLAQFSAAKPAPVISAESGAHSLLPTGTLKCMDLKSLASSESSIHVIDVGPGHKGLVDFLEENVFVLYEEPLETVFFPNAIS